MVAILFLPPHDDTLDKRPPFALLAQNAGYPLATANLLGTGVLYHSIYLACADRGSLLQQLRIEPSMGIHNNLASHPGSWMMLLHFSCSFFFENEEEVAPKAATSLVFAALSLKALRPSPPLICSFRSRLRPCHGVPQLALPCTVRFLCSFALAATHQQDTAFTGAHSSHPGIDRMPTSQHGPPTGAATLVRTDQDSGMALVKSKDGRTKWLTVRYARCVVYIRRNAMQSRSVLSCRGWRRCCCCAFNDFTRMR